jgi:hypothetical protein
MTLELKFLRAHFAATARQPGKRRSAGQADFGKAQKALNPKRLLL